MARRKKATRAKRSAPRRASRRPTKKLDAREMLFNTERFLAGPSLDIGGAVKYVATIAIIPALVGLIATFIGLEGRLIPLPLMQVPLLLGITGLQAAIAAFVLTIIGAVLSLLVWGTVLHIACKLVGGLRPLNDTMTAAAASMTPMLLLGWIPFIQIIAAVQSLAVLVFGLNRKQTLTIFEASLAVALPIILIALVGIFLLVSIPAFIPLQFFA
ncbi:MAG: hypothetical protein GOV02_00045 [Candidatus Aenigmarchaeota archaeon]|nr:hypothetical protein [Candidatus Aenigmarchaeota archaeon]